jgi:nicotinamide-nucleotide amidase
VRAEVIAVGTELLLGQVVDTNAAYIGEQLATAGIDSYYHVAVGDNQTRIVETIRTALTRSDAVICCGGLGPTQDDLTRDAIAEVMGARLVRDEAIVAFLHDMFTARGRTMAPSNLRQADVPEGASLIPQRMGTAPGLICPINNDQIIYAVPGVPAEMREMMGRAVIPDLQARQGETAVILSRTVRTWGIAESTLADLLADRMRAIDRAIDEEAAREVRGGFASDIPGVTIAFLASGIEGIKVRLTTKAVAAGEPGAATGDARAAALERAQRALDAEEHRVRELIGEAVFGLDDETMELAVSRLLIAGGLRLAVAESLTGGMIGARLTAVAGASDWFRGGVISYAADVKQELLGVTEGPVVSEEAARQMAAGARAALGAEVGLAVTGVAGPTESEGQPVGTVWVGLAAGDGSEAVLLHLPGEREQIRMLTAISALDLLRRRLLAGWGQRASA